MPSPSPAAPRDHVIAAVWGAAEATAAFIVPDVWLTRIVLTHPGQGYRATLSALAGAIVGGLATRWWAGRRPPSETAAALRRLPSISAEMIERTEGEVARVGLRALVVGPARGIPYKLYARAAGLHTSGPLAFAAWSIPARLPRFLAVTALAHALLVLARRALPDGVADRIAPVTHALAWIAFYTWYFTHVGRERPQLADDAA